MTDEEKAIVQQPRGAATVYHANDDERPKCNIPIKLGEWAVVPIEEAQADYNRCQKCAGEVEQRSDGDESILSQARNGSPQDFGLEKIPELRKQK